MSLRSPQRLFATVTGSTAQLIGADGRAEKLDPATASEDIRLAVIRRATAEAQRAGEPIELVTRGDRGEHHILVGTDGALSPVALSSTAPNDEMETVAPPRHTPPPNPRTDDRETPARTSFVASQASTPVAKSGIRGALARAGFSVPPSHAETERSTLETLVSRHWAGCRTIAVVNGKGGVGKTLTTAMLAAVYGRYGGGNVLAWDNNDTRGTLGWRTEAGLYDTTIRDLIPMCERLLSASASMSDIARFVHHQSRDHFDVLRSNPELLAADQRITQTDFDQLMRVAARYFRMVVFDSGNDESAPRWLRMIDSSQQLVLPTLTAPESAESAALLLDALRARDQRSRVLAENAVVVVTQSEASASAASRQVVERFSSQVRRVIAVPYDPALKAGPMRFDMLRPATKDAWLHVAAAAAEVL